MSNSLCRFVTINTIDEFYQKIFQALDGSYYKYQKNIMGGYDKLSLLKQIRQEIIPNIYETDIVFIKDIHTIWTQGEFWIPDMPEVTKQIELLQNHQQLMNYNLGTIRNNLKDLSDGYKTQNSQISDLNSQISSIQDSLATTKTFTFTANYENDLKVDYCYFSILPSTDIDKMAFTSDMIFVRMVVREKDSTGTILQDTLWKCKLRKENGEAADKVAVRIEAICDTELTIPMRDTYQIKPVLKEEGIFQIKKHNSTTGSQIDGYFDLYVKITGPNWLNITGNLFSNEEMPDMYEALNITKF